MFVFSINNLPGFNISWLRSDFGRDYCSCCAYIEITDIIKFYYSQPIVCRMPPPKAKLSSYSAACCCLICCLACACEQCILHRHHCPHTMFEAKRVILSAIKETERLDRDERKTYLLDKLKSLKVKVKMTGKYFFTWQVGTGADRMVVCRAGFELAYQISHWYTDDLITRIKDGDSNVEANFTDRTALDKSGINDARVIAFCKHFGISLSRKQIRALKVPNSMASLSTVAWMNYYFKLMAENVPNIEEELYLEPVMKKLIYEEYCFDVTSYDQGQGPIAIGLFLDIWKSVFFYVKVRKFKQCCGKCNLCSALSELRRKFLDSRCHEEVANSSLSTK